MATEMQTMELAKIEAQSKVLKGYVHELFGGCGEYLRPLEELREHLGKATEEGFSFTQTVIAMRKQELRKYLKG